MSGKPSWTLVAITAIALICGVFVASPVLEVLRGLSLDALTALRWRAFGALHEPSASPTVVIALDADSYRTAPFKGAPTVAWTREIGRVVNAVLDSGATVIGFDVVLPTSIEESEIPLGEETMGARLRGFDRDFLRALAIGARAGKIVLGEVQHGGELVLPAPGQRAAVGQQRNIRSLNVYSEADGVVRRTPLMLTTDDKPVPSMSLELASRALAAQPLIGADGRVSLAGRNITGHTRNALTLNFDGGSDAIPTYSFADLHACVDKGDMDFFRRAFAGKVVLFGSTLDFEDDKLTSKRFAVAPPTTAPERCALPASGSAPVVRSAIDGVYVHATAVNNLMRGEGIAEIGDGWRWLVVIIGALAGAFAAFFMTPLKAASSLLIAAIVWIVIATVAFKGAFALPLLEPLAAAVASLIATTGFRLFVVDRDKRFLRRAFELYLAPAVIEKMLASNKPPVLGGEMRAVTLFFSDIVGFSSFSEAMQPADLVLLMNRYLSVMTDAIEKHGGFVDKYIGDAIVAMFGAPAESVDHAAQAVRAALACQRELEALNRDAAPRLAHRIGLNSGRALVGNIGSRRRFNYTVMGDTVNLASRLEGANKYFGTSILASGATVALTGEAFAWREIDTIRVKGRGEAVRIYEPLGEAGRQSADQTTRAASYAQGLQHWRGGDFAAAAEAFAECADSDKPSALFLARARKLLASHPVAHWEPVQTLDEK